MNKKLWAIINEYDINGFIELSHDIKNLNTVLNTIVKKDLHPFVSALGQRGIDFSFMNSRCLLTAISIGSHQMIYVLCNDCKCNPNARSCEPLKRASRIGFADGVECLFDCGAKPSQKAFIVASSHNHSKVVEVMLTKYPHYSLIKKSIGAYYAIINNNEAMLLRNLQAGAKLNNRHLEVSRYHDRIHDIVKKHIDG